jgi:hypothetical protein
MVSPILFTYVAVALPVHTDTNVALRPVLPAVERRGRNCDAINP